MRRLSPFGRSRQLGNRAGGMDVELFQDLDLRAGPPQQFVKLLGVQPVIVIGQRPQRPSAGGLSFHGQPKDLQLFE